MEGGPQGGYPLFSPRYVAWQKSRVFVVTFISYTCFHLQKNVYGVVAQPIAQDLHFEITTQELAWAYTFFNAAYAVGMFFMGHIADRTNIRLFLGMCMICAGVGCMICGVLQLADSASYAALAGLYIVTGIFQSGGWPSNVAVMGVWFGKKGRGLIMGIWTCHVFVGNILGKALATYVIVSKIHTYDNFAGNVNLTGAIVDYNHSLVKGLVPSLDKVNVSMTQKQADKYCDNDKMCVGYVAYPKKGSKLNVTQNSTLRVTFFNSSNLNNPDLKVKLIKDAPFNFSHQNGTMWSVDVATDSPGMLGATSGAAPTKSKTSVCREADFCTFQKHLPWSKAFYANGGMIVAAGVIVLLFLVPHPRDVGLLSESEEEAKQKRSEDPEGIHETLLAPEGQNSSGNISPLEALFIPGVIEFAICFFFTKFVVYAFMYWLPQFLEIEGFAIGKSGYTSTLFDLGGMAGGIFCGLMSDLIGKRAIVCAVGMALSVPSMYVYRTMAHEEKSSDALNGGLLFLIGFWIQGVYALITTAVSADLGTHESLKGNAQALGIVTAIIDGTGSLGAAFSGVGVAYLREHFKTSGGNLAEPVDNGKHTGLNGVFLVFEVAAAISCVMLTRLVVKEIRAMCSPKSRSGGVGIQYSRQ